MGAEIVEDQPRARNEISHSAGNQNLAATGEIAYSGCDIDGNSANVIVVPNFDLAGMQARTDSDAKRLYAVSNGLCAANSPSGPIECCKNPVAKRFHLSTAESTNLAAGHREMRIEDRPPHHVTKGCSTLS